MEVLDKHQDSIRQCILNVGNAPISQKIRQLWQSRDEKASYSISMIINQTPFSIEKQFTASK
jgi:hypothetical protein